MRIRGSVALRVAVAAGLGTIVAGAAVAHEPDQRLPPITLSIVRGKAATLVSSAATTRLLSERDRYTLNDTRTRSTSIAAGPVTLGISGSRLRTTSQKGQFALRSPDRVSVMAAGFDAGIDMLEGLTLHAFSSMMRVKRRIDLLPGTSRSLNSSMTAFGMGIERSALGSLVLDYTDNNARGRRDPLSRMTEQVGGAVPFGKGMRVSLTNATATDQRGRLTWTLSAAAVKRPMYDNDFSGSSRTMADRRAEMAFRIAL
ncbi:hypothetical protein ASG11_18060 [Sphingomonas sp. Leaf357]|uniref:hypothetical protein n=1 Tax=Sphingomonas sp. Leaf357 TaxID=1736350 RepID=UPI0006FB4200|nr:hypothetical protein [Sphingomonas sp. Leaf357]KQS01554.1 hypothetical protein ASG11_18060 [Sphingomonas sp. Leaf357]